MIVNILYLLLVGFLIIPITIYAQSDIEPDPDQPIGPVTNVGLEYKFDPGFYDKIKDIMDDPVIEGDPGVFDGTRYYDTILVISRGGIDGDVTAKINKESLLIKLNEIGARDIYVAEVLSFITASIPVGELPGISIHDEVYALGDGEQEFTVNVDQARRTINSEYNTLNQIQTNLDGSGVTVSVIDTGINHVSLNDKIKKRNFCPDNNCWNGTGFQNTSLNIGLLNYENTTHGTRVAQIIASTGLPAHNGIAPGVSLLDAMWGYKIIYNNGTIDYEKHSTRFVDEFDWSHKNKADVVNLSAGAGVCDINFTTAYNLIINESVDKGMVSVTGAGNEGGIFKSNYKTITNPGCGENTITVGGINDRGSSYSILYLSSRGPGNIDKHIIKPEIVAPASYINVLNNTKNNTFSTASGTSYATPMVSSTSALMLQLDSNLTPAEIKALLLLGADWRGIIPCSSMQYEINNNTDKCSWAYQPDIFNLTFKIDHINNIGFGILNTEQSLQYIKNGKNIVYDYLDVYERSKKYKININDESEIVKIILTWMVHPHGSIKDQVDKKIYPPIANLGFNLKCPNNNINKTINSVNQTIEFIVFEPTTSDTCIIDVSGTMLDRIDEPIQNFALASTAPFKELEDNLFGQSNTVYLSKKYDTKTLYISSANNNNENVTYTITQEPLKGTITSMKSITNTHTKLIYTPNDDFSGSDTFQFTPKIGNTIGTQGIITIVEESLPPGSMDIQVRGDNVKDWKTILPRSDTPINYRLIEFTEPLYEVEALHIGSNNVEGGLLRIVTIDDKKYNIVIPDSNTRMFNFTTPILIKTMQISSEWLDNDAVGDKNSDFRAFVGLIPVNRNPAETTTFPKSIEMNGSPIIITGDLKEHGFRINEEDGRITSGKIYINITDIDTSDLKITLKTPADGDIYLFNRLDRGNTYQYESTFEFDNMVGKNLKGDWALKLHNFAGHNNGKITGWKLQLGYMPNDPIAQPVIDGTVIFKEDFENGLKKWNNYKNKWSISNSFTERQSHIPWYNNTNKILHTDACINECKITLKRPIDLSNYDSASLSFMYRIDTTLDGDEYLKVELRKDNTWETVYHWSNNIGNIKHGWQYESFDLSDYLINNLKIRFTTQQDNSNEDINIDDIIISDNKVAKESTESVYVVNTGFDSITVFTDNILLGNIIQLPRSSDLRDIAFDNNGDIYVSDYSRNMIYKYDKFGSLINNSWANATTPSGMEWHNDKLYVATRLGVIQFNADGDNLGYFGDIRRSTNTDINAYKHILSTNDVTFCNNKIYVNDDARDVIIQYNKKGEFNDNITNNNINSINIECDKQKRSNIIYQSVSDNNTDYINVYQTNIGKKISNKDTINTITNQINKPHGLDFDKNDKLYVANTGANNILIIDGSTNILDKQINAPKGVQIGPKYQGFMGASNENIIPNNPPVISISYNGTSNLPIITNSNSTMSIDVTVSDQDNDSITISLDPDMIPQNNINLTDNNNGTGTVQINTNIPSGDYVFWIKVTDGIDTELLPVTLYVQ